MRRLLKIVVEKHDDGYVAYPLGVKGVVVGEGDTYEEALVGQFLRAWPFGPVEEGLVPSRPARSLGRPRGGGQAPALPERRYRRDGDPPQADEKSPPSLAAVQSAIRFHIESFGREVIEAQPDVIEAFVAQTAVEI